MLKTGKKAFYYMESNVCPYNIILEGSATIADLK